MVCDCRRIENLDLYVLRFMDYGKEFPKSQNMSPDAYIQLALQLTYYRSVSILNVIEYLYSTPSRYLLRGALSAQASSFFFSLFHQRADDEALTRFLQTSLFLVASPILVKSMFHSFRSSLTLSIQVFLCLPLLLFPSTCPCKAAFGNLFSSILSTCPNHCSHLFLIFCTTVSSAPSSSLVCSFLTFSLLLLPMILLSQLISATNSLRSSSFLRLQHSEPYSKTGTTRA